jgi:pSer/pThr/pTyr-binding forkhead associated (FHA) protein
MAEHFIVVIEGPEPGERIRLGKEPVVIGRKAPSSWLLKADPLVSRMHCRVSLVGDQVMVADLNSTNGTYINGGLVIGNVAWPPGSKVEIGNHILEHQLSK